MSIYVGRIVKINQTLPPAPQGVLSLNCLHFFPNNIYHYNNGTVEYDIPLYQITPYYLRDAEGHIFENIWQGSKCFQQVDVQNEIKAGKIIWSHPAEVHIVDGQLQPAFWKWRKKLWNNSYAVRYPNGYHGRHACLYALWHNGENWEQLNYIAARKKIYCKVYAELVQATEAYKLIKALHDTGQTLQICEMDVRPGLVTEKTLRQELNNPQQPFGHGYVLAACLMGLTHIFDE